MVEREKAEVFLSEMKKTIAWCREVGCGRIYVKSGDRLNTSMEEQCDAIRDLLIQCAKLLQDDDIMVLLEPISYLESPNMLLGLSEPGFQIVRQVGDPHVKLLYDIYHMQLNEGDVTRRITDNIDLIGHIHAAGIWERHELPDGELDYDYVFRAIDRTGYNGYIGLEYFPSTDILSELNKVIFRHQFR